MSTRPEAPAAVTFREDVTTHSVTLAFLTPMFGGGVRTNQPGHGSQFKLMDDVTPVRGASVRGQLRYWWRATSGAWCKDTHELRRREAHLFGSAASQADTGSGPGSVATWIDATALKPGNVKPLQVFEQRARAIRALSGIAYGAFPLSPSDADNRNGHSAMGTLHDLGSAGTFDLRWQCNRDDADELWLAVSAWVAFGGLGGRTTRGFGQLTPAGESSHLLDAEGVLERVRAKGKPPLGDRVPAIDPGACRKVDTRGRDAIDTLNSTLGLLRDFRQGVGKGRRKGNQQPNRPGRSFWPEPDAIRRIANKSDPQHQTPVAALKRKVFPRAAFGMPIIFHFQSRQDPGDTSLQPAGRERMRSPLQLAIDPDGRNAHLLVMTAPRPGRTELVERRKALAVVEHTLTEEERRELASKGSPIFTNTDVLLAFLDFAAGKR